MATLEIIGHKAAQMSQHQRRQSLGTRKLQFAIRSDYNYLVRSSKDVGTTRCSLRGMSSSRRGKRWT